MSVSFLNIKKALHLTCPMLPLTNEDYLDLFVNNHDNTNLYKVPCVFQIMTIPAHIKSQLHDISRPEDSKVEGWGVRELTQFVFTVGDITRPDK